MKNAIFRAVQPDFLADGYLCYDYVQLNNLSDISADRTIVTPQRTAV